MGEGRFRGPRPPEPWMGVRDATVPGPVSIQASMPFFSALNAGAAPQSEDCLYLNVWTPSVGPARKPVLVWIHGGGFLVGAGSTPIYGGRSLARSGDMVVVTINYRLGALGHVHLNGVLGPDFKDASNAGIKDQVAALEWVRDNIDRFGGDPSNVTVAGQSAGAMSVGGLLAAPSARGLFRRAILQSGAADHLLTQDQADQAADVFLRELGRVRDRRALGGVSVGRILRAQGATNRRLMSASSLMAMTPCIDGTFIPEHPFETIARGELADVEILIGTTLDEWKLFGTVEALVPALGDHYLRSRFMSVLAELDANAPPAETALAEFRAAVKARGGGTGGYDVWNAFQSARVFHYPAMDLAERHTAAGGTAYQYLFKWRPRSVRRAIGACHAIDIPFVFGLDNMQVVKLIGSLSNTAHVLSSRIQGAWSAFVHDGSPIHDGLPSWEPYDAKHRSTMLFGRQCYVADAPLERERSLLAEWLPR